MLTKIWIACVLFFFVSACSSVQTAKDARGTGDKKIYLSGKDDVWLAMLAAVLNTGGAIKEKDENQCYILASYGASAWSWGEKIAVFCQDNGESVEVEVVMKAALKTNITAVKRAPQIFKALSNELGN